MLFFADFTLPKSQNSRNKVTYAIWSSGVGCNTPVATSKEFESNRTEILRLLLTLTSQSMYMSANLLPVQGVKAISYIVTCPDKQVVLSVLCSLLNTVSCLGKWLRGLLIRLLDFEVQPSVLEDSIQCPSIQRPETNTSNLFPTSEFRRAFMGRSIVLISLVSSRRTPLLDTRIRSRCTKEE